MKSEPCTPRFRIGRFLPCVVFMLGYGTACRLLADWVDTGHAVLIPALGMGGMVIGFLLGRMLSPPPAREDKPSAPAKLGDPE